MAARCEQLYLLPWLWMMQERFYFGDTVLPLFESGIPLVRQRMQSLPDADNITIAYPDEGAWKRFHYQFGDYPEARPFPFPHHSHLYAKSLHEGIS